VLSILSYRLSKYPREIKELSSVLQVEKFTQKATPLDLSRAFLFMAYNYSELYPDPQQG
jgi:hypothetical protein